MSLLSVAAVAENDDNDKEALQFGRQILFVARTIENPETPGGLDAIRALGTDARYYKMVRGWLMLELKGDQSIISAAGTGQYPHIESRIAFLQKSDSSHRSGVTNLHLNIGKY